MKSEREIRKRIDDFIYVSNSHLRERDRGHAADKADLLEWVLRDD